MTSPEARRDPRDVPTARSQRDLVRVQLDRLESALYRIQTGGSMEAASVDALCSIAASLVRLQGPPAARKDAPVSDVLRRLDELERALEVTPDGRSLRARIVELERQAIAFRNSASALFARVDRLDEVEDEREPGPAGGPYAPFAVPPDEADR